MKRFLKSALSMVLAVCMILSFSVPAFAADTEPTEPQENLLKIVFLDCGRKYFSSANIKKLIDAAAEGGSNAVMLGVGNNGLRFVLDDMSVGAYTSEQVENAILAGNRTFYNDPNGNALTQAEMDDIIAYAGTKNIEIIPLVETPGHMHAMISAIKTLGMADPSYHRSVSTIDLNNTEAVAFVTELLTKYAQYFGSKGCKHFNIGADEYANDIGSMGINGLISSGMYPKYVDYINSLNAIVKANGMTTMAFNDGFYYDNHTEAAFDTDIMICYWSSGWSGYHVAPASVQAAKGHPMINTNGSFYWILKGNPETDKCPPDHARDFDVHSFPGSTIENPSGGMFCIWCDVPSEMTDTETIDMAIPSVKAFGESFKPAVPGEGSTMLSPVHIEAPGMETSLNGETIDLPLMRDGNPKTHGKIMNTQGNFPLKGKYLVVEFDQPVESIEMESGGGSAQWGGDVLTVPVGVYLSTDGIIWGEKVGTLDDSTETGRTPSTRTNTLTFANPEDARYIKLVFEENSTSGWTRIRELRGKPLADTFSPVHIDANGLMTNLNGENIDLPLMRDGNPKTHGKVMNTNDLQGKSLTVRFDKPVGGIELETGGGAAQWGGDVLTVPVGVYLSTDGQNWGEKVGTLDDSTETGRTPSTRTNTLRFDNRDGAMYVKLVFEAASTSGWTRIREIRGLRAGKVQYNVSAVNMTLGNTLAVNLLVKKSDVPDLTGLAMEVTKPTAAGTHHLIVPATAWEDFNSQYYAVTFDKIAAKEMTDTFSAVILKEGREAGEVYTDSVAAYALRILRGSEATAELKTAVVDMLNYGTAAQKYFEYHLDALADAQLTPQEKNLASAAVTAENICTKGPGYVGANLNLGSSMALTVFFRNITPDMHAVVKYTRHTGEARQLEIPGRKFVKFNDTVYGVRVNTLAVADAYQPVEVKVYDADGNVVASGTDSIESYVARANSLGGLGDSIMKFAASAKAYFASLRQ